MKKVILVLMLVFTQSVFANNYTDLASITIGASDFMRENCKKKYKWSSDVAIKFAKHVTKETVAKLKKSGNREIGAEEISFLIAKESKDYYLQFTKEAFSLTNNKACSKMIDIVKVAERFSSKKLYK